MHGRMAKLIILVVVLIVVILVLLAVFNWSAKDEAESETEEETEEITLFNFDIGDVETMTWEYKDDDGEMVSYTVEKVHGVWIRPDDEGINLDQSAVEEQLEYLVGMTADRQIDIDSEDQLADYGLDEPVHVISLHFTEDSGVPDITFSAGDYSTIAYAYYAAIEGQAEVYLVNRIYMNYFSSEPTALEVTEEDEAA